MDCQHENNKCDEIFGECRCYADVETSNPLTQQKCGIRKNGYVIPGENIDVRAWVTVI